MYANQVLIFIFSLLEPDQIHNLTISKIQETSVTLSWRPPRGAHFYRLCVYYNNSQNCVNVTKRVHTTKNLTEHEEYTIKNLVAGGEYIAEVSAEVADMSILGQRFNQTFFTSKCSCPICFSVYVQETCTGNLL